MKQVRKIVWLWMRIFWYGLVTICVLLIDGIERTVWWFDEVDRKLQQTQYGEFLGRLCGDLPTRS